MSWPPQGGLNAATFPLQSWASRYYCGTRCGYEDEDGPHQVSGSLATNVGEAGLPSTAFVGNALYMAKPQLVTATYRAHASPVRDCSPVIGTSIMHTVNLPTHMLTSTQSVA